MAGQFRKIYVPVDNSDYSNRAIDVAVELGRAFGSALTGTHVYAARLHDYRFKQMEYTLPDEYRDETELERQRRIHDSLIAMGLATFVIGLLPTTGLTLPFISYGRSNLVLSLFMTGVLVNIGSTKERVYGDHATDPLAYATP